MLEKQLSKISKGIAALGLIAAMESCGPAIIAIPGPKGTTEYCISSVVYDKRHPCYAVIEKYKAEQASSSSSSGSSYSSEKDSFGWTTDWRRKDPEPYEPPCKLRIRKK